MGDATAKRARVDGTFNMDPDIDIHVEGEIVPGHSSILMVSSPVFRQMLSTNMVEGRSGAIQLKGKNAEELRCFLASLSTATFPPLTDESAMFLSRWADEYEVGPLKAWCEKYIMEHLPVDGEALKHAITHNLYKRVAQCTRKFKSNPVKYVDELLLLASPITEEHMRDAWPELVKSAGLAACEMPDVDQICAMSPFVKRAIRANSSESALKPKKLLLERIKREMVNLPGELHTYLPLTNNVNSRARDWLTNKIRGLLRPEEPTSQPTS